ncbi:MAG TPA: ABC transporter permease subunit [Thermoplasmata archaeon]|nr:ABC transporter permease subunit [Thermoplasmata archaeon]
MRGARRWLRLVAGAVILAGVAAALLNPSSALDAIQLPLLGAFSTARMVVAYLLSLVFAIVFGHTAATNKKAAIVMLPLLDVLQSIPILVFFPAALLFFVATFHGNPIGIEFAVVFLIFTSMAWNMAFGVYESLTTIPQDLEAAATSFGLSGWLRFRLLAFPAVIPKLVYNSILSWTNGWFFLVASEIFSGNGAEFQRPGLGAFIAIAGRNGDVPSIAIGLAVLAAIVLALDVFVWRPLSVWSERFRIDAVAREGAKVPRYEPLRWLPRFSRVRRTILTRARPVADTYHRASVRLDRVYASHRRAVREIRAVDLVMFLIIFVIVVTTGLVGLTQLFLRPLPAKAGLLPEATLFSFTRLLIAYGIALAWTIPMAVLLGESDRASRLLTPVLEIFASLPATALLPVILGFSLLVAASVADTAAQLAAILIALFSMQWYLLFNLIAGVRSIPEDLREAARSFGLRGRTYWKRVLLPAMTPSLLTGSITAWGAGWNALIVSEFVQYAKRLYEVPGLGSLLSESVYVTPDGEMLFLTALSMIVVVLAMNKLLWRPLFKRAAIRYRLEV